MQKVSGTFLILTPSEKVSTALLAIADTRHFGLGTIPGLSEELSQKLSWFLGETSLGLCDLAVVERRRPDAAKEASIGN
jgi:hypothetical protein